MILRILHNAPAKATPVAMVLIVVGLSLILIALAWPTFSPSVSHIGTDWNDFARGFLFGLAIVVEIAGVAIAASATAKKSKAL